MTPFIHRAAAALATIGVAGCGIGLATSQARGADASAPTDLVMSIGATQSERLVTWYTASDTPQKLRWGRAGTDLAREGDLVAATSDGQTSSGEYNHRAALTHLKPNTRYDYRVGSDETGWSPTFHFRTPPAAATYSFLFFGDPQVGASGNLAADEAGWVDTINVALDAHPEAEMLFSAGDQVQDAPDEDQYAAFLAPAQLRSLPLVPVNGNHDVGSLAYNQHFSVPHLDPNSGAALKPGTSGGDYYFVYKDTLYVVLNSNSLDHASHEAFMRRVLDEVGDTVTWKILAFHHSIYSVAAHVNDSDIRNRRAALPAVISELGFDVVLMGHDHSYTRTYLLKDGNLANPDEKPGARDVWPKAGEVAYLTANSASGSKYYTVKAPRASYASVINQEKVRNYSLIEVSDCALTMTTRRSQAHGPDHPVGSIVDAVTVHSSAPRCHQSHPSPAKPDPSPSADGSATSAPTAAPLPSASPAPTTPTAHPTRPSTQAPAPTTGAMAIPVTSGVSLARTGGPGVAIAGVGVAAICAGRILAARRHR